MPSTRVILTDDHAIVRHAVKTILESSGEFSVVGEADTCAATLALARDCAPDIAVVDLGLPGKSGLETILELAAALPQLKVIVLTMYDDEQRVQQALGAGAKAYLLKNLAPSEFLEALRTVRDGGTYIPQRLQPLLTQPLQEKSTDPLDRLSRREREIFYFLAEGLPNRSIAKKLFISPRTVETHRARVLKKFGFISTAELIRFALRNNLLSA